MVRSAALGAWEFVVGDDWMVALGVVVTLGITAAAAGVGLPAWLVAPIAILAILHRSIGRRRSVGSR
jgi:hypothetical protein